MVGFKLFFYILMKSYRGLCFLTSSPSLLLKEKGVRVEVDYGVLYSYCLHFVPVPCKFRMFAVEPAAPRT